MIKRRIILSGGGSGGSVTPLLAVLEKARLEARPYDFVWLGTAKGPEKNLIAPYKISFYSLPCGKWRRYWHWQNIITPFLVVIGFCKSCWLLVKLRPDAVLTAGSFVSVPLVWAAWCLNIPTIIHEQDVQLGLANKLMRPFASLATGVWQSPDPFVITLGNFVRPSVLTIRKDKFSADLLMNDRGLPLVLIIGGGTGALSLNKLVPDMLLHLRDRAFIIHLTGLGKEVNAPDLPYYVQRPLALEELSDFMRMAVVVVSRAGMATLSELAALSKAVIVIPLADSHQEANARMLQSHAAAVVLNQKECTALKLSEHIINLLEHRDIAARYGRALHNLIPDGTEKFLTRLDKILAYQNE